jgi:hypothetical protein
MVRLFSMVTVLICLVLFYTPSEAKTSVPLSFFIQNNDGFVWSWFYPSDKSTRSIHTFKEKPAALYWEKGGEIIRVIDQGKVISFSGAGTQLNETPIELPQMLANEKAVAMWRDANDQALRIATWVTINSEQVQDGTIHLNTSTTVLVMTDPEWGWHAVVRLFKLDDSGWAIEQTLATKSEAGDTPGLSVIKSFWNEQGASNLQRASQKFCGRYGSVFMGRRCDDGHIDMNIRNSFYDVAFPSCKRTKDGHLHPKNCDADTAGFIMCESCKFDLVHATREGDSLHAMLPVYLRHKESGDFERVSLPSKGQIRVDVDGHHAFIESYEAVTVIDLISGQLLLKQKGTDAFWFPTK